jgi:hypothetical protein
MRMRFAKARLVVALVALFAWVGYVAYQAVTYGRFPVVSHAQLLNATAVVVADLDLDEAGRPKPSVRIVEALWSANAGRLAGETITVQNLPAAHLPAEDQAQLGRLSPGLYILPLQEQDGKYFVAGLPRSPGFQPRDPVHPDFFIYPATPIVREQFAVALTRGR